MLVPSKWSSLVKFTGPDAYVIASITPRCTQFLNYIIMIKELFKFSSYLKHNSLKSVLSVQFCLILGHKKIVP